MLHRNAFGQIPRPNLLLLLAVLGLAAPRPAFAGPGDEVLRLFSGLAAIFRPSGQEAAVRAHVLDLAASARRELWGGSAAVTVDVDRVGNVLLRLPATGPFRDLRMPAVGLQAHLDMVLAVAGARPGEDLSPYFRNGVTLAETDGWLHSRGNRTSVGFDNGLGVAMMLRYLMDPTLPHPPLELLFTVDEEVGCSGAQGIEHVMTAESLVNLDSEEEDAIGIGSMASAFLVARGALPTDPPRTDSTLVDLALSGLAGGHSGGDIHLPRLNAALVMSRVLRQLRREYPSIRLVRFHAGDFQYVNKIPAAAEARIAVRATEVPTVRRRARALFDEALEAVPQESGARVTTQTPGGTERRVFSATRSGELLDVLNGIPNGVLELGGDCLNGVKTSSSVGAVRFEATDHGSVAIAVMPRSMDDRAIAALARRQEAQLRSLWTEGESFTVSNTVGDMPAWHASESSWLVRLARARFPHLRYYSEGGTIEVSILAKKFPKMEMLSLGILVQNAHTELERVQRVSVGRSVERLDHLLVAIGDTQRGRPVDPCPPLMEKP